MLHCHGTEDPVIYYKWGLKLEEAMKPINPKYEMKSYEGLMHGVNDQVNMQYTQFIVYPEFCLDCSDSFLY